MKSARGTSSGTGTRAYRMTARAAAAEETGHRILAAALSVWREVGIEGLSLKRVAERAGVSVQTVIRRFGSRDGLIEAGLASASNDVLEQRDSAPVGDVNGALAVLLDHYEQWGDASLGTLALEERYVAAKRLVEFGRAAHRAWCERYLAPPGAHADLVDALVAATDVYVWKLLHRDLGRSRAETLRAIELLVSGVIGAAAGSERSGDRL